MQHVRVAKLYLNFFAFREKLELLAYFDSVWSYILEFLSSSQSLFFQDLL